MTRQSILKGENIPFIQAYHVGPKQRPTAVVLRTSFTTGDAGAALGIANAWHNPNNREDSCHYVVDRLKTFRCIPDRFACKSTRPPGYKRCIVINVCYNPPEGPEDLVLHRAAKQTARLCKLHRIRLRVLDEEQERLWSRHPRKFRGGIVLATAGEFSTDRFFDSVQNEYRKFD